MHMALLDGPRELYFTRILLRTIKEAWHTAEATEPRGSAARDSVRRARQKHGQKARREVAAFTRVVDDRPAGAVRCTVAAGGGADKHIVIDDIFDIVDRTRRREGASGSPNGFLFSHRALAHAGCASSHVAASSMSSSAQSSFSALATIE